MRWLALLGLGAAWALAAWSNVLAADGGLTIPSDPVGLISTFGFPTAMVVLFVMGQVFGKAVVEDVKKVRDESVAGWRESTTAINRLAAAIEERNKIERDQKASR